MNKKPYEISIWEDVLADDNKAQYQEKMLAIIGSSEMTAPQRAVSLKFGDNINGSFSLTFTLYTRFFDEESQDYIDNPYTKLLSNERKIKLKYDGKWYDLVIKNVIEDSSRHSYTYTAQALHINELAKNGFNITFDSELENNTGTVEELGAEVIKGTDWAIAPDTELIQQKQEEPLFSAILKEQITAKDINDPTNTITIPADQKIYIFYSCLNEQAPFFQFLYREDGKYELNDDYIISNSVCWYIDGVKYIGQPPVPTFVKSVDQSPSQYRGERYVRSIKTKYDELSDGIITVYKDGQDEVYVSSSTEYLSPITVKNLVTNPSNFIGDDGWTSDGKVAPFPDFYPPIDYKSDIPIEEQLKSSKQYLKFSLENGNKLCNSGFVDNRLAILKEGIAENEEYVLRTKFAVLENGEFKTIENGKVSSNEFSYFVAFYSTIKDGYEIGEKIFDFTSFIKKDGYFFSQTKSLKPVSYKDLLNKQVGIFLQKKDSATEKVFYLEDLQVFKYVTQKDQSGVVSVVYPDTLPYASYFTNYKAYKPSENKEAKEAKDIIYCYSGQELPKSYVLQYDDKCSKVRSIKVSESNRFNILQDLCELFECWVEFEIEHEPDGRIKVDENGRQLKWVRFKNYITQDNHTGFKYGINLNSIERTIDSDEIVSKIIVKDNSNEYAKDGYCSIARAKNNPTSEAFLYNFKYYYTQGLLNYNEVMNDLYNRNDSLGYIGYYAQLREINKDRNEKLEHISVLATSIDNLAALHKTYSLISEESGEDLLEANQELNDYHPGYTYKDYINPPADKAEEIKKFFELDPMITELVTKITTLQDKVVMYDKSAKTYKEALDAAQVEYDRYNTELEEAQKLKDKLNEKFYYKYSRFIQEGSWIGEDYIDDELYYYDAESTLSTSAEPQVSYIINVIDVSQIPGFEGYTFHKGDITTMEDTEFFGWTYVDGVKTPVKQEIIISEVSIDLDNAENNKIVVQNYKTRFEDLFQRISAATSSLEYSSGSYDRAAGSFTPDGQIKPGIIEDSLANNSFALSNSGDQTVTWDNNGITVTSPKAPNALVRVVNGGIYLTVDGGKTWSSAITGYGINASYINAGQIDTSLIRIMNGSWPTFKWDSNGISAYSYTTNPLSGELTNINYDKFVRFDQHGLYGLVDAESVITGLDDIEKNGYFGLTWDGFFIKSIDASKKGMVKISSSDDIQVLVENGEKGLKERIKIGRIKTDEDNERYGIVIRDGQDNVVMETVDDGSLWLKNRLNIGVSNKGNNVAIGKLDKQNLIHGSEIINASDKFVVYEDGSIRAMSGEFSGEINAISGTIGGAEITPGGITVANGGFKIVKRETIKARTRDTSPVPGKTYYTKTIVDDKEVYTPVEDLETFDPTVEYYEDFRNDELLLGKEGENLIVNGQGSFTGSITATSGTFSGTIKALSGELVNITAGKGKITIGENGIYSQSFTEAGKAGFKIEPEGKIYANEIYLGNGATIDDYLKLGNAYIYNPTKHENKFIEIKKDEVSSILIKDDGTAALGNIFIDGVNSRIYASGWSLEPNIARFNNITASGTIRSAVFEKQTTQLSGGTFIFKDGVSLDNLQIASTFNTASITFKGDADSIANKISALENATVLVTTKDKSNSFIAFASIDGNTVTFTSYSGKIVEANYDLALILEKSDRIKNTAEFDFGDWLIGVNATDTDWSNMGLYPNAISFSKMGITTPGATLEDGQIYGGKKQLTYTPKIILGKIPKKIISKDESDTGTTYGLYAESVYLTGTLTTERQEVAGKRYAGVNTLSGVSFNAYDASKFNSDEQADTSPIIFWAGANGTNDASIQEAPFQVTSAGTLYAQRGYFEGSILTNATLEATKIVTAEIVGKGNDNAALVIRDSDVGIIFKDAKEKTCMALTSKGLELSVPIIFKDLKEDEYNFIGIRSCHSKIVVKNDVEGSIVLEPHGLGFSDSQSVETLNSTLFKFAITGTDNKRLTIQVNDSGTFKEIVGFSKNNIQFSRKTQISQGFTLGNFDNPSVEYREVAGGLDIYVYET